MSLAIQKIDSALADRREVRSATRLVFASRPLDCRIERGEVGLELAATEVLVADDDQHLAGLALAASNQLQADRLLVGLRRGQRQRPGGAVEGEQRVQPKAPRTGGCGWRSSRSRRRLRAGCGAWSRGCARTPPGWSRPAPTLRRSRGCGARTRRSTLRSFPTAAAGACGRRCARADAGTAGRAGGGRLPGIARRSGNRASPGRWHSVITSASVIRRRALAALTGRRSSTVQ